MDYSKGLDVCVGNYGYYNEGQLRDAWITLPKSDQEIKDFLAQHGLQDVNHEEIYISDYDELPFSTNIPFNEYAQLGDLNLLAKQLATIDQDDIDKVNEWTQVFHDPKSITELMNLIAQVDDIDKVDFESPDGNTPEENYAFYVLDQNSELSEMLASAGIAVDYQKTGYDRAIEDGVTLTDTGFIRDNGEAIDLNYFSHDDLKEMIDEAYEKEFGDSGKEPEPEATRDTNVRNWYLAKHPDSFLGQAIRDDMTFDQLSTLLNVFDPDFAIGVNEEGIKGEILGKLSEIEKDAKENDEPEHECKEAEPKRESAAERMARVTEQAKDWNASHDTRSDNVEHDGPGGRD